MTGANVIEAAVLERPREPLKVTEVELEAPRPGEVMVELVASGVCHSDVAIHTGELPASLPLVLGHEGAGRVVEVGEGVTDVAVGDHVVLSWLARCGTCFYCVRGQAHLCRRAQRFLSEHTLPDGSTRLRRGAEPVRQFCGLGTFARHCVVLADSVIPVPRSLPLASAALIGCAVLTGFGAAVNTAELRVGDTVVVIGCGGVGLSAIQGARIAGAASVVAVDVHPGRLALAERLGATHALTADSDVRKEVRKLTGGRGADVVIEVAGRAETIRDAVALARPGGQAVIVSAPAASVTLDVPAFPGLVLPGKTVRGCVYGSSDVRRDVPRLVELYERGRLKLDELITDTFDLSHINDAMRACAQQQGARSIVALER